MGVYDNRGNLTAYGSQRYDYDGLSRQAALNSGYERYLYDGSGERIARVTAPSLGTKLFTISPCRVLDTRSSPPAITTTPRVVQMSGGCGIPLEASGVVGNLAAIPLGSGGLFRLYPTGTTPATSTLNFNANQVRANNFQLGLSGNGQLSLSSNTTAEAVVDVVGYFGHDLPTWTVTLRDEANRLASEYTVPPAGQGSITRLRNHLYLGNLLVATRNSSGGYTYWASDHLGTPRVGTGSNPETHKYQPFGTEITTFGALPIKFASMERDLSSGNDFDHARYQSSLLGRFLSADVLGGLPEEPQSWNRYIYAFDNPLRYRDPFGLEALDILIKQPDDPCKGLPQPCESVTVSAQDPVRRAQEDVIFSLLVRPYFSLLTGSNNDVNQLLKDLAQIGLNSSTPLLKGVGLGLGIKQVLPSSLRIVFKHGARHLAEVGMNSAEIEIVEAAIRSDIAGQAGLASTVRGSFWGRVQVLGREITYRAYGLADGLISVGTTTAPK